MTQKPPALEIHNLSVNFDHTPALWDISLSVPSGKLVGIIGPNGAGKSTLIKAVMDLIPSFSGIVEFFKKPLNKVRHRIAYVPQRQSVDWDFPITVEDLVLMGRYGKLGLFKTPKQADYAAVARTLEICDITFLRKRQISQLSQGQQQRVFIARALLQDADIYFMDEPFAGIDLASETLIMNILKKLRDEGKTVFVVHHDLNTVENYFDWLIMLNMRLIASGPVPHCFTTAFLKDAYGKNFALLDEAFKMKSL